MRILLRSDVSGVGKRGDLVDVADGYARNFLVPKGFAIAASAGVERQAAAMRRGRDIRDAHERAGAEEIARRLVPEVINVAARAGAEGKLFGSVTAADVADAVLAQTGIEIDKRDLDLHEPIKSLGRHEVAARLHPEVQFHVVVEVAAS